MVKIIEQENNKYYQCEACGLKYEEKDWAEKCEAWCRKNKSCNLEIIKHAISDLTDSDDKLK